MGSERKTCVACGEERPISMQYCPVCGCPSDRFTISGMGFPSALEKDWELTGFRNGSSGRLLLRVMEKKSGKEAMVCKLQPYEELLEKVIRSQKAEPSNMLPKVYEVRKGSDETLVLFEHIPGQTLQELAEQSWPLDRALMKQMSSFLEHAFWELANSVGCPGEPDLCAVGIAEGKLRLMDYGGNCREEDPRILSEEWKNMPLRYIQGSIHERKAGTTGETKEAFSHTNLFKWILIGILAVVLAVQIIYIFGHLSHV